MCDAINDQLSMRLTSGGNILKCNMNSQTKKSDLSNKSELSIKVCGMNVAKVSYYVWSTFISHTQGKLSCIAAIYKSEGLLNKTKLQFVLHAGDLKCIIEDIMCGDADNLLCFVADLFNVKL